MADLFLPTLHTFAMDNIFTGSCGAFRFRCAPKIVKLNQKEVDFTQSTVVAEFWHGPFCYEKSTMEGEKAFPLTAEGRQAMKDWLEANI